MRNVLLKFKQKKVILSSLMIILILFSCLFFLQYRAKVHYAEAISIAKKDYKLNIEKLGDLKQKIEARYIDSSGFIKGTTSLEDIQDFEKTLKTLSIADTVNDESLAVTKKNNHSEFNTVKSALKQLELTFLAQTDVNNLFNAKTPVLVEKTVKTDVAIVNDLTVKTIDQIDTTKLTQNDFSKAVESLKNEAKNQLNQIEQAKISIEKLFKDGQALDDEAGYNQAQAIVNTIRNEKAKKAFNDKLAQVKKVVDEANQKEAAEKAKAEAEVQANAQAQQTTQNYYDNSNSSANTAQAPAQNSGTSSGDSSYSFHQYTPEEAAKQHEDSSKAAADGTLEIIGGYR